MKRKHVLGSLAVIPVVILALVMLMSGQTTHSVTIHWTPSTSSCVTSVIVHRVQVSGTEVSGTNYATVLVGTSTFVDTAVVAGQTYYYKLSAYGVNCDPTGSAADESVLSAELTAVVPADKPQPPTGLTISVQ